MSSPAVHFSADYSQARARFRAAVAALGLPVESFVHPVARGPQGEELATDVVRLGSPAAPDLVVVTSGVHGVEAFCGSGSQIALLYDTELLSRLRRGSAALLLVHAVNPYGFAHLRRVNEDNIDLNRNRLDFSQALPRNEAYAELHELLLPAQWPPGEAQRRALEDARTRLGARVFQAAVSVGQSDFPEGLFYAGRAPSWSSRTLASVIGTHGRSARHIVWMDVHTGLGPSGHGEKIHVGPNDPRDLALARAIWGADVVNMYAEESASAVVRGPLITCVHEVCPQARTALVALEFGTEPLDEVLEAMRGDHWLQGHPEASAPLRGAIKRRMRDAFYVDDDVWRGQVVGQVRVAVLQALSAIERGIETPGWAPIAP